MRNERFCYEGFCLKGKKRHLALGVIEASVTLDKLPASNQSPQAGPQGVLVQIRAAQDHGQSEE